MSERKKRTTFVAFRPLLAARERFIVTLNQLQDVYAANDYLQRAHARLEEPCPPISLDGKARGEPCACRLQALEGAVAEIDEALRATVKV
jgi:hypothetical protein